MLIYLLISFSIGAVLGIGIYFSFRYFVRQALFASLGTALFLIKIPREAPPAGGAEKDFKLDINRFEELLADLSSLKKPFIFEVAVPHVGEEIHLHPDALLHSRRGVFKGTAWNTKISSWAVA